jgi:hypothetical protein
MQTPKADSSLAKLIFAAVAKNFAPKTPSTPFVHGEAL